MNVDQRTVALLEGQFQLVDGFLVFTKTDMNQSEVGRGCQVVLAELLPQATGLIEAAHPGMDVRELRDIQRSPPGKLHRGSAQVQGTL